MYNLGVLRKRDPIAARAVCGPAIATNCCTHSSSNTKNAIDDSRSRLVAWFSLLDSGALMRFALGGRALLCWLVVGIAGCHPDSAGDIYVSATKVSPATVSAVGAWSLFDRSVTSGFIPGSDVVRLSLDDDQQLAALKIYGASPYRLRVTGEHARSIGFAPIDLSTLSTGWNVLPSSSLSSTGIVELRFEALGKSDKVSEIELWAVDAEPVANVDLSSEQLPAGFVGIRPDESSRDLTPGDCTTFDVELTRSPATFRKLHLAYVAEGLFRTFSVQRSINGLAEQGGFWRDGNASKRAFVEQVDPNAIHLGRNEIRMCLPADASRGVALSNLHFVAELDRGKDFVASASIGENARDAHALLDRDAATSTNVAAGESVLLQFDRLVAPDAVELTGAVPDTNIQVSCLLKAGEPQSLKLTTQSDDGRVVVHLDAGTARCSGLSLTFRGAALMSSIDVLGSGASEAIDWPFVNVTSPAEHFGTFAWIGGFVARPNAMTGAIRVDVAGTRQLTTTGDFGQLVTRSNDPAGEWPVLIAASTPDGQVHSKNLVLATNQRSQLATANATPATAATGVTATKSLYGREGDVVVARARKLEAISVRLGTAIGVDVPIGAVSANTNITVRHLGEDIIPPLDPGMINVTAPKGRGFEFLPHGQKFAKDVEVVIPYDASLIPEGMTTEDVHTFFYDPVAKRWKQLDRRTIDVGQKVLRSSTNHFTIMINAVLAVPKNSSPLSFDPTALSSIAAASPATNIDFIEPPSANSTGDARVALPLRLPQGRGAYSPSLSVGYSSSGGNGWLGLGFDLSTSRIEIDTRWGVPTYAATEEPRYLLDGSELVPTTELDGPKCQDGSVGQRYRARIEGAFNHVLRCDHSNGGFAPAHFGWEVRDRDGTLYVYGVENDGDPNADPNAAALTDPEAPHAISRWSLRSVVDVHGNTTKFSYVRRDEGAAQPGRETYPDRIDYTSHANLPAAYSVAFELDDATRPDAIVSARPGFKTIVRHLLRKVTVRFGEQVVRDYVLTYEHGQFDKSLLKSIKVYGSGGCNAGANAFVAPTCSGAFFNEHTFDYYRENESFAGPIEWRVDDDPAPKNGALIKGDSRSFSGDVGSSFPAVGASVSASVSRGNRDELLGLYDVDSDGKVDQVFDTGDGFRVLYNQFHPGLTPDDGPLFSGTASSIVGIDQLGHDRSDTWALSGGLGYKDVLSLSAGISRSTSRAERILTDINGDSFIDVVDPGAGSLLGSACPQGLCFVPAAFGAAKSASPRTDSMLASFENQIKAQNVIADPVVQWIAPFDGQIVVHGAVQRRAPGDGDGVSIDLYHGDTFVDGATIAASNTASVAFPAGATIDVNAGDAIYLRTRTGIDDGVADDGTLKDFAAAHLSVEYTSACTETGCAQVTNPWRMRQPTGAPVLAFDSQDDFRLAGSPAAAVAPAGGTIALDAQILKHASVADLRICVQRFASLVESPNVSLDAPCDSTNPDVTNISGTIELAADAETTIPLTASIPVELGQYVVLRVESDLSFDPASVSVERSSATSPLLAYTTVCVPSTDGTSVDCTAEPTTVADVAVAGDFGPFAATRPEPPRVPYVAAEDGVLNVIPFAAPSAPFLFAVRSDRQGALFIQNCKAVSCADHITVPQLAVSAGESITFEMVTDGGFGSSTVSVFFDSANIELANLARSSFLPEPGEPTVFAGGYRQWRTGFWNDDVPFAASKLLTDLRQPSLIPFLEQSRREEIARSFITPIPLFAGTDATQGPAWAAIGAASFVNASGGFAGYTGVSTNLDASSNRTVGGVYAPLYARLSGTWSFSLSGSAKAFNLASVNLGVGASWTKTSTDIVDMNGDGVADFVDEHGATLGAMTSSIDGAGHAGFDPSGEYRYRQGRDYSFGFGLKPIFRRTTSGGRTLDLGNYKGPDKGFLGLSGGLGLGIGRSETTKDLIDVNGDGLPDLVRRDGTQVTVQYNLGRRFGHEETFGSVANGMRGAVDGFEDSVEQLSVPGVSLDSTSSALTHETSITQTESGGFSFEVAGIGVDFSHSRNQSATRVARQVADINGDGLPDLLFKRDGEPFVRVQYNRGADFSPAVKAWITQPWTVDLSVPFISKVTSLGLTGPDVLGATGSDHSNSTSGSVGIPIIPGIWNLNLGGGTSHNVDTYDLSLIDVDGDGAADHVLRKRQGATQGFVWVKHNEVTGRANLMRAIKRPLGGTVTLDYERVGNTVAMPHSKQVLSRVEVDDGIDLGADFASPNVITSFAYEDGFFNRNEKEFFGFHTVTTTRADNVTIEEEYANASYVLHGRLLRQTRRDGSGHLLDERKSTYDVLAVVNADGDELTAASACSAALHPLLSTEPDACLPRFPVVVREEHTRAEGSTSTKTQTARDLSFDRFGNVLASLDEGDAAIASDDVYASATYANDTTRWIIGRPTSLVVRAGTSTGTLLRSRSGTYNTAGQPTTLSTFTGAATATTGLTYDAFGNVATITTPPNAKGEVQTYTTQYDATTATYPINLSDGFGYQSSAQYDLRFGVAVVETDLNGSQLRRNLDEFGRLASIVGPYDTATTPAVRMEYVLGTTPARAITTMHASAPSDYTGPVPTDLKTVTSIDGLARPIEVSKTSVVDQNGVAVTGMTTSGLVKRDATGLIVASYNPFFTAVTTTATIAPQATFATQVDYDAFDRPIKTTYADTAVETTTYEIGTAPGGMPLFLARSTAANGHVREAWTDQLGRVRAFVEHPSATSSAVTSYDYLATGELSRIVDAEGNATTMTYDLRGLRTALANPDAGLIEDRYDLMGNRVELIEPNHRAVGSSVKFVYTRDRLEKIDYPSKRDVSFEYGGPGAPYGRAGRIVKVDDESGTVEHFYGALGETRRTVRTVRPDAQGSQDVVFDLKLTSDSLGRQLSVVYPDGVVVKNSYDAGGMLSRVEGSGTGWSRVYAQNLRYDEFGNRIAMQSGNGVVSRWTFDPKRIRLATAKTTLPNAVDVQNLRYEYDPSSNPTKISNLLAPLSGGSGNQPGESTLELTYDGADQLLRSVGSAQLSAQKRTSYDQQFVFSASHNLTHKQRVHLITQPSGIPATPNETNFSSDYQYDAARPHLPKQIGDLAITYDASGNPTVRRKLGTGSQQNLVWDDDNRLADYTGGGVHQHNTYDASGNRVRRKSVQSETLFSSQYFDLENGTQSVRHVFAGGTRVASELGKFKSGLNQVAPDKRGTAYFFHSDHLGSTSVVTAEDASVHESLEYFSDGETWIDRAPQKPINGYLFSGKPFDPETGFYDFGQRFYDPRTSIWLSVDRAFTTSPNLGIGKPFTLSVSAYAAQNPIRMIDPDGNYPGVVGPITGFVAPPPAPAGTAPVIIGNQNAVPADGGPKLKGAVFNDPPLPKGYVTYGSTNPQPTMGSASPSDYRPPKPDVSCGPRPDNKRNTLSLTLTLNNKDPGDDYTVFYHGTTTAGAAALLANKIQPVSTSTAPYPAGSFFAHAADEPNALIAASAWPIVQGKTDSRGVRVVGIAVPNRTIAKLKGLGLAKESSVPGLPGFPYQTVFLPEALPELNDSAKFYLVAPEF